MKKMKCDRILNNSWCVKGIHLTFWVRKFDFEWPMGKYLQYTKKKM